MQSKHSNHITSENLIHEKLSFLCSGAAHPHTEGPIELIETHLSWVVLAGERAIKLKKPVKTDWADLRDLNSRHQNAQEELRLNQRLAPQVYLGLLAMQSMSGKFSLVSPENLQPDAVVVDWLISMRRLPAPDMLDQKIKLGTVTPRDIDKLAQVLTHFYQNATPSKITPTAYVERFAQEQIKHRHVLLNPRFKLLQAHQALDDLDRALERNRPALSLRAENARLVEGHGDLRPEHVYLGGEQPVVIDALEFSEQLRQVDPFDELSFLGLECDVAGAPWIGPQLIACCRQSLNDHPAQPLLCFYTAHRSLLRARLCLAHLLDPSIGHHLKWQHKAQRYIQSAQCVLNAARLHDCD